MVVAFGKGKVRPVRLASISVTHYRSLIKAHKVKLDDLTVLIGQNNEGKSNLLSAINVAMTILSDNRLGRLVDGRVVMPLAFERVYHWERDFPLSRQERTPNGVTTFRLEFRLSEVERADFKADIGSTLNENLAIEMLVGRRDVEFRIVKSGRGATTLNRRARRIAQFIRDRVSFTYIPAVRTASTAMDIVRDMVDRELRHLELDTRYQEAIAELGRLQQPVLDSISTRKSMVIGTLGYSRSDLEEKRENSEMVNVKVIGLFILADDVTSVGVVATLFSQSKNPSRTFIPPRFIDYARSSRTSPQSTKSSSRPTTLSS